MHHLLRLPRLFLAAAALCLALNAPAADPAAAAAPKPRPFPFQSVVVSVNADAHTFCMGKKVVHQVHVVPETKITQSDATAAAFEALAPGVEIRGAVRKRADGDYDAVSVKIGAK
jgi:hypothetical protein